MSKIQFKVLIEESKKRAKENSNEVEKISRNFEEAIKKLKMVI